LDLEEQKLKMKLGKIGIHPYCRQQRTRCGTDARQLQGATAASNDSLERSAKLKLHTWESSAAAKTQSMSLPQKVAVVVILSLPQSVPQKVAVAGASVMQQWRKQLWAGRAVVVVSTVVVLVLVVLQAWIIHVAMSTAAMTRHPAVVVYTAALTREPPLMGPKAAIKLSTKQVVVQAMWRS
jgi:hypothetical protein